MGTEWNFFLSFGSLNEELQEWEQSHYIEVFCPLYSSFNWQNVWLEFQNNFSCSVRIYTPGFKSLLHKCRRLCLPLHNR